MSPSNHDPGVENEYECAGALQSAGKIVFLFMARLLRGAEYWDFGLEKLMRATKPERCRRVDGNIRACRSRQYGDGGTLTSAFPTFTHCSDVRCVA